MEKILFPFQSASDNRNAYAVASAMARRYKARLTLLNTYLLQSADELPNEELKALSQQNFLDVLKETSALKAHYIQKVALTEKNLELAISYRMEYGKFFKEVRHFLQEEPQDLLVLNFPPEGADQRDDIEGLAIDALERYNCDVLIADEGNDLGPIRNIAYTTDLKPLQGGRSQLERLASMAKQFDATMHFLHVSNDAVEHNVEDQDSLGVIRRLVAADSRYSFVHIKEANAQQAVRSYIEDNKINLLLAVRRERSFIANLFHTSFTGHLAALLQIPVYITQDRKRD